MSAIADFFKTGIGTVLTGKSVGAISSGSQPIGTGENVYPGTTYNPLGAAYDPLTSSLFGNTEEDTNTLSGVKGTNMQPSSALSNSGQANSPVTMGGNIQVKSDGASAGGLPAISPWHIALGVVAFFIVRKFV